MLQKRYLHLFQRRRLMSEITNLASVNDYGTTFYEKSLAFTYRIPVFELITETGNSNTDYVAEAKNG